MVYNLRSFSSKCSLFHNSNIFGSCFIHILYTGCAKIEENNSGAKRLNNVRQHIYFITQANYIGRFKVITLCNKVVVMTYII